MRGDIVRFVLVAAMKAEALQQLLEQAADPNVLTLVLDETGQILARSRDWGRFGSPPGESGFQSSPQQWSGLFLANTPDHRRLTTAFRRSSVTGWSVFAASDRSPLDDMSARSTWATVWAGALSLLLAAVLAVFLFYNVAERRVSEERLAASRALSELDARLLAATQESLAEQRKAASERDVLMREIYHRVKNNLQIVQSLLRLGSRDLRPEQREPFESAIRRIGAMARVHTLLYNSPDLASIDFKDYLEGLLKEAAEAFGAEEQGIRTVLNAESMRVPLDTAVPLAFVTVEILTNAFKHAFPEGRAGAVVVTAIHENGHGVLTIADNGVGLPAQTGAKRSLGLTIIGKLVDQIGGSVEKPAAGESTFRIRFPIHEPASGAGREPQPNP
jgi:two-component sensor histidine kinase